MNDNKKTREVLKQLPSIDKLLQIFEPKFPLLFKPLLKEVISGQLKSIRSQVIKNKSSLDIDHLYKELISTNILNSYAITPNLFNKRRNPNMLSTIRSETYSYQECI